MAKGMQECARRWPSGKGSGVRGLAVLADERATNLSLSFCAWHEFPVQRKADSVLPCAGDERR